MQEKPRDVACFSLHPVTLRLLLFYIHCIKADVNVKLYVSTTPCHVLSTAPQLSSLLRQTGCSSAYDCVTDN